MAVVRNRELGTLHLSQEAYIDKLLTRFNMEACNAVSTPMESGTRLEAQKEGIQANSKDVKLYQAVVGSLIYLLSQTRPDIAFEIMALSRYLLNPSVQHEAAAKRVLKYLKGTKKLGIIFGKGDGLLGYTDADWAGDIGTRKSTGAYIFTLYGGAFSWQSKLQSCVALSSCEAEYMAQTQASKEAIWIGRLLKELDIGLNLPAFPVTIKADNQGAIALAKDPKFHSRTKHIDLQWHFVREQVENRVVNFEYCSTKGMAADGLTKALDRLKHAAFVQQLGLVR